MKTSTRDIINRCLRYRGGRSRPDKSAPAILDLLSGVDGTRILDVGCGRGSFADIIRAEFDERFVIDGVEVYEEYIQPQKYNHVFVGDYTESYDMLTDYDIYLFVDVVEHFPRSKAIEIMRFLHDKTIIASIPNAPKHWRQDPHFEHENRHEAHLHDWTDSEVEQELGLYLVSSVDGIGVYTNIRRTT